MSERLITRMRPAVFDLARCVAARDQAGIALLLARKSRRETEALLIMALECADPEKLAVVTRRCRHCGRPLQFRADGGYKGAQDYCRADYDRWRRAGFPGSGPPPAVAPADKGAAARARATADRQDRICRFARLLAKGHSIRVAADLVGVATETGYEYSAELKKRQQIDGKAA